MVRGFRDGDELKKMEERSSKARCGSCGGGGKCEGEAESFGVEGDGIRVCWLGFQVNLVVCLLYFFF